VVHKKLLWHIAGTSTDQIVTTGRTFPARVRKVLSDENTAAIATGVRVGRKMDTCRRHSSRGASRTTNSGTIRRFAVPSSATGENDESRPSLMRTQ